MEFSLFFSVLTVEGQPRPAMVRSRDDGRSGLYIAASPEQLPKVHTTEPVTFGALRTGDEFKQLLRELAPTMDVILFQLSDGTCGAMTIQELLTP